MKKIVGNLLYTPFVVISRNPSGGLINNFFAFHSSFPLIKAEGG